MHVWRLCARQLCSSGFVEKFGGHFYLSNCTKLSFWRVEILPPSGCTVMLCATCWRHLGMFVTGVLGPARWSTVDSGWGKNPQKVLWTFQEEIFDAWFHWRRLTCCLTFGTTALCTVWSVVVVVSWNCRRWVYRRVTLFSCMKQDKPALKHLVVWNVEQLDNVSDASEWEWAVSSNIQGWRTPLSSVSQQLGGVI